MSTLAEIEAAIATLPAPQVEELAAWLEQRRRAPAADDAFAPVIGAFAGPHDATGRKAEEILYGPGA